MEATIEIQKVNKKENSIAKKKSFKNFSNPRRQQKTIKFKRIIPKI